MEFHTILTKYEDDFLQISSVAYEIKLKLTFENFPPIALDLKK